jgi:hypothetical protein
MKDGMRRLSRVSSKQRALIRCKEKVIRESHVSRPPPSTPEVSRLPQGTKSESGALARYSVAENVSTFEGSQFTWSERSRILVAVGYQFRFCM